MPRAFDQNPLNIDRDPLRNFIDLPNLPTLEVPDIFAICNQPFISGLKLLGTGEGELSKIATGIQAVIDTLFGTLFCNAATGLTPQTMFGSLGDLLGPILANPFVVGLVEFTEFLGRETGTFLGDVFQGLVGIADWICGVLSCDPAVVGATPLSIIGGIQAAIDTIVANPFIQGIVQFAEDIGVAVGNFALDIYYGLLGIFEALCSLVTTGTLPTVWGSWSNTPQQILTDLAGVVTTLLGNPIIGGLSDLVTSTGSLLYDTVSGLVAFISELVGLFGTFITGPQAIIDFLSGQFGEDGLLGFINTLPIIGPLVSKLTGFDSSGDIALDLATLGNWAANLLTTSGNIPADRLIGSLPEAIFATLPVSSISFTAGNLLSQGAFANSNTVEAAGGWSWDANTTATGTGGALKATATGAAQQIYSRQTIKIAAGDRVDVSAKVKTAGFTSGSMVLSIVPWIGNVAQPAQVIATRTSSAATFTAGAMTGSRLRFGGTAEAGEVLMSASITAITVRLAVTANTGAQVWFDDVSVKKAGALGQTLVEYLTTTWEQAWDAVFTSGGAGKQWFDFVTAVSTIFTRAKSGVEKGDTANGNALGIIDSIGKAVFGEAVFNNLPGQVKTAMQHFIAKLFGVNTVQDELTGDVLPPIDATTLTGDVPIGNLPTEQLLPTAGSGAQVSRRNIVNKQASPNKNRFVNGFYDNIDFAPSADIQVLNSSNNPVSGSGAKSNLAGIYRVTTTGWYVVELCVKINPSVSFGGHVAALLYRSSNYPSVALTPYKTGGDGVASWWGFGGSAPRFVQSTFIVYMPAGAAVAAGYTADGYGSDVFDADADGTETYFSISLLNKIL